MLSVLFPSCSSRFIHMRIRVCVVCQPPPCHASSPPWLPVSAPPTSLDEYFFFNSTVVELLYSLIFWQFWLFFVFKSVVVLLLVVWGNQAYLPTPPSWPEVQYWTLEELVGYLKEFFCTNFNPSAFYKWNPWVVFSCFSPQTSSMWVFTVLWKTIHFVLLSVMLLVQLCFLFL